MFLSFRRKEQPWEVVDCKAVNPVLMYSEDDEEAEDLDVHSISNTVTHGTYVFDLSYKHGPPERQLQGALSFSQQQLLREVEKKGFNILLVEGWKLTILRRGKYNRVEVQYSARAAKAEGKIHQHRRPPPFIGVLDSQH
ncbi:hypothetical protein AGABI1DRAFT_110068 [Agaricus bisporus var. burnettii JB137-S8]|uniref:Uncharacterized protein n=2 Tax=Agaricus bisporus var. burnettii TaxID=192524 RepID=K5W963_AGABU|nr:hypothetical protein AGABI2DRAFT_190039 [Agaricus bisporus var. bisporus H97]XP_007325370.1 uncharacterized protein AGABI1DRAFT_110068 [Agaricus bisporus var. burnettii JB137-S8]EKM83404.1 hypothetical protein AGABI1DRAFT_110068 [Agaricus bisporus var. burnettii JB137-S8]EKV51825.1 hypothetical protein AGABI2DRAFT_190039 [Agaricus bisporus var. bisporus H97]KAF7784770.1 hypothetical protein Agabi119p4_935 [Agaricus bisporus var. burnettii]